MFKNKKKWYSKETAPTKLDLQLCYRNLKPKLKRAIYVRFETVWFLITISSTALKDTIGSFF